MGLLHSKLITVQKSQKAVTLAGAINGRVPLEYTGRPYYGDSSQPNNPAFYT
jgi:hypothetical protein